MKQNTVSLTLSEPPMLESQSEREDRGLSSARDHRPFPSRGWRLAVAATSRAGNQVSSLTASRRCRVLQGQQYKLLLLSYFFSLPWGAADWDLIMFIGRGSSPACWSLVVPTTGCFPMASAAPKPGHLAACPSTARGLKISPNLKQTNRKTTHTAQKEENHLHSLRYLCNSKTRGLLYLSSLEVIFSSSTLSKKKKSNCVFCSRCKGFFFNKSKA